MAEASITLQRLQARYAWAIREHAVTHGDEAVTIERGAWREVMQFLRDDPALQYNFLMDLTAVDTLELGPGHAARFEVVAHLYSLSRNMRVRMKAPAPEDDPRIDSLMPVWEGANWFEREAYDMFGITFDGHPDLKRVLMPDYYEHFPLRKDYPLTGRGERDNFVRAEELG
jgi:NADH-quinone oxidoreductase subunit C